MENREIIKAKLQQSKLELEQKTIAFTSQESNTTVSVQLSQHINEIIYNGAPIEKELVLAINRAVAAAKENFEREMMQTLQELGIKM
jgi:DNA-binding protein YbaB